MSSADRLRNGGVQRGEHDVRGRGGRRAVQRVVRAEPGVDLREDGCCRAKLPARRSRFCRARRRSRRLVRKRNLRLSQQETRRARRTPSTRRQRRFCLETRATRQRARPRGPDPDTGGGYRVEALDAATGAQRWLAHVNGRQGVFSLAADSRAIYVGGDFTRVNDTPRPSLVALDPRTGRLLSWHPPTLRGGPPGVTVQALALAGRRLYVGASPLTSIGGQKRRGLAALDARSGRLTPWIPATADGYRPGAA